MSEYEQIIDEIVKHGVVVKVNKIVDDNYIPCERKYVGCVVELDFTEHDKVFENKIAELENQIAYMKEKKNYLRTRCMEDAIDAFDRGSYGALTIVGRRVDLESENEKLKQRIAELENKNKQLKHDIDKMATSKSEWIDKAVEWQQKCEKLESKESVKPMRIEFHADNGEMLTPLEVANSLINQNTFKVDELRELSEFLQVYCNHHEDRDIEPNIMLF